MSRLLSIGGRLYRGEVSFDFVGRQRLWYTLSALILMLSIVGLGVRGLNFTVDFKGGSLIKAPHTTSSSITEVRNAASAGGAGSNAIVQSVGTGKDALWQVQTGKLPPSTALKVQDSLASALHVAPGKVSVTFVGPSWGSQISQKAAQALVAFLIVIVIYLSIAFEWRMAVAALIALAHDLVIATGVYALAGFEVSPATVIGLLTILGYSLYDTVVVFDKVRENTAGLLGNSKSTYSQAANLALNQTLVRSINTSVIALLPVASILFIGGGLLGAGELNDLALVLFVGMLSGTYSSIFIATPVLAALKEREPQYKALAKRVALRSSGGRAAKRAGAKTSRATVGGTASRGTATALADSSDSIAQEDLPDEVIHDDDAPPSAEKVPAGRTTPRQPGPSGRPGTAPRQQPRRSGSAKRRPGGKKKRR